MRNKWKKRSGEGYIDTCVLILCAMLVIALAVKVLPVYVAKQQLDTFAAELVREAEITGRVGSETTSRAQVLSERDKRCRIREQDLVADVVHQRARHDRRDDLRRH